jgi:SAM-dependent methyltransferase
VLLKLQRSKESSKLKRRFFQLPYQGFGIDRDERVIEIPWALSLYSNEQVVLEIGVANITKEYENALIQLPIKELHGIDITEKNTENEPINKKFIFTKADIRKTPYKSNYFDLIFCISTIEHIGRDNDIYLKGESTLSNNADFETIIELTRILKKGGRLIITVPFGKYHNYGWFIHYDDKRLVQLIKKSELKIIYVSYYKYNQGWHECKKEDLANTLYKDNSSPAAGGLSCICLQK